jgi:hypothetical protein
MPVASNRSYKSSQPVVQRRKSCDAHRCELIQSATSARAHYLVLSRLWWSKWFVNLAGKQPLDRRNRHPNRLFPHPSKPHVFSEPCQRFQVVRRLQVADQRRLLQSRPTRLQWQSSARPVRVDAPAAHSRNPRRAANSHTPVHCSCYQIAFLPAYSVRTARRTGERFYPAPG